MLICTDYELICVYVDYATQLRNAILILAYLFVIGKVPRFGEIYSR